MEKPTPEQVDLEKIMLLVGRVGEAIQGLHENGAVATAIVVNPYTLDYMIRMSVVEVQQLLYELPVYTSATVKPGTFRIRAHVDVEQEERDAA